MELGDQIIGVLRVNSPLSPDQIEKALNAAGVTPSLTEFRDKLWEMIFHQKLELLPDRTLCLKNSNN